MPLYKAKLATSEGKIIEKRLNARNSKDVFRYFRDDGYFVFSVKKTSLLLGAEKKVSLQSFLLFNRELAGLIRAGLPIVDGLGILLKKMEISPLKTMVSQILERLVRGASLSEAFTDFEHMIPAYFPTLLYAGEQSGQLVEVLEKFIQQEDRKRKALKKFRQALTYPIILLAVAAVALYVILGQAMPEFAKLYAGSGQDLPFLTRMVIGFSEGVAVSFPYLVVGVAVIAVFFSMFGNKDFIQTSVERVILRTPVFGKIWRLHNQNALVSSLKLLLQGGIPVAQALKTMCSAVPSRLLGTSLEKVWNDVVCGVNLSDALSSHTNLEHRVMDMIRIGETSGTLDEMLEHLISYGEEQLDDQLEWISGIIAPVLLLVVGGFIAALVLAMYLPMFKVTDLISH